MMENEEAIKIITKRIDELADVRALYDKQSEAYKIMNDEIKALLKGYDALERLTPKKPVNIKFEGSQYTDMFVGRCPACGQRTDSRYKSCQECRQALDWSEVFK